MSRTTTLSTAGLLGLAMLVPTPVADAVGDCGGDYVICVTAGGASSVKRAIIDPGAGDDIVYGTTAPDWIVQADLGAGADRFEGGNAGTLVSGAYSDATVSADNPADTEKDSSSVVAAPVWTISSPRHRPAPATPSSTMRSGSS